MANNERERESNSSIDSATSTICHTGALAEISQLQIHNRDISVSAKPQYDKDSVIASEDKPERGNLVGLLAIQGDCHESACADSRNDKKNRLPRGFLTDSFLMMTFLVILKAVAEVSLARHNNRDISGLSPQYDKNIELDCYARLLALFTMAKNSNDKTTNKSHLRF